ncbi:MAG TPA: hypothetical protein VKZ81_32430 [Pseudonocardia sp.]|jgi:hypothetical protein|uniref:hypothetical protein n=1 Tax=Pseudonocardia sp. TaxID=60912 RepID=UPI002B4AE2CB|nr:hypothetical protein [Pseudonocardia sp.]HLU60193.1 hypothetical protein [Pseudonocardia sp.]
MTTPAERVFAIDERERGGAPPGRSAYGVTWAALRARYAAEDRLRDALSETERRDKELVRELVVVLHKLREFVAASGPSMAAAGLSADAELVGALADRLAGAIARRGGTVIDPVGLPYADVADLVDVLDGDGPWVTKTERAGLRWTDGEVVCRAQVLLGGERETEGDE